MIYLNEDPDTLFKEYLALVTEVAERDLATTVMSHSRSFPDNLKYSFEFFQKVVINLDGHKLNAKIQQMKIKLFA
ncbi:hypothetical protein DPEC_G00370520 [Dallia pectoralis]|nr:hypothetical protein DPEC_G00370520 [Dallia pectoralis]